MMLQFLLVAIVVLLISCLVICLYVCKLVSKRGALGPCFTCTCCKSEERIEQDMNKMRGWRVHIGEAATHYAIFSKEDNTGKGKIDCARLVIHVHGLAGQLDQTTWGVEGGLAQALVNADYTLLAIDLYGHGFTDAPDSALRPDEFVHQFQALLEHLGISNPFDLVGFSLGSFIAAAYAAKQPSMVKSLVLTSPFGCYLPCHSWRVSAGLIAAFVQLCFAGNLSHMRTIYRVILHLEGSRWQSVLQDISSSAISVLIIAGSCDRDPAMRVLQTARRIHTAMPQSKLHVIPWGTHMTWASGSASQQREFQNVVIDFCKQKALVM